MARAFDVAKSLIQLAASEDEPDFLSHLRLQKLLYYVQGWCLANRDEPMFPERIEAWAHGPVVRDLYAKFADYGYNPIPPEHFSEQANIEPEDAGFIYDVWQAYKGYSASSLREMTHREAPWVNARRGLGPADRCDEEITHEAMKQYFRSRADT